MRAPMERIGTSEHPLRVAIVGSGPSGFYAAGHLLKSKSHPDLVTQVDVYDRLPTPWGLVRGGVAPDHPNIKAVSRVYEKTAQHPEFRFFGNVEVGRDLARSELQDRYHAVIYAVGAQTDRRLGIPGEDLPGSWAATELVAWYNGHPDYRDLEFDLSCERAVVIGNGNVAADVARMLALTRDELAATDVADHALEVMAGSGIREIVVLGRRGPAQAAFTNPELLELGEMTDADVYVDVRDARARPPEPGLHRERGRARDGAQERGDPHRLRRPRAGGQAPPDRPAVPGLARGDPRRERGHGHPDRAERAGRGRDRIGPPRAHRRVRDHRLRARVPLDRVPRRAAGRPALRRARRGDPERRRPGDGRELAPPRRVRGRLDQARSQRASSAPTSATPRRR